MGEVLWEEVRAVAKAAFDVWDEERELAWAEEAWGHLAAADLTSFTSDVEWHRVLVRFRGLPSLYRDWSARVDQESRHDWYSYWAETLELRAFSPSQLLGPEVEIQADTEAGQVGEALDHLPAQHEEVANAFVDGPGLPTWHGLCRSAFRTGRTFPSCSVSGVSATPRIFFFL